ncbi:MAG: response regulator [Phycisphaerales bacterium]
MVLVIDDDPTVSPLIAGMLRRGGEGTLRVSAAASLRAGLEAIVAAIPEVVLLDLRLPDSDGLETIRRVRASLGDAVPVIAVTADGDRELAIASLREGADDFLLKNELTAATVARTVRYAIERAEFQRSRRQAEAALRASNARLEAAIDAGRLGVWGWEFGSDRVRCAGCNADLFGCAPGSDETSVEAALSRVHAEDRGLLEAAMRAAPSRGDTQRVEFRIAAPDGRIRWIEGHGRLVHDADGAPTGMAGVIVDVTERRLASARHVQSQRLEAIGELAAGVAHDLGNVLALGMTAMHRLETTRLDADAAAARDDLTVAMTQARELVGSLLAFASPDRGGARAPSATDLGGAAEAFVRFLRRVLPARLRLSVDRGNHEAWVAADRVLLQQVLMNLVLNARDAVDGEGHVEVRVRVADGSTPMHLLEVLDDGPGVPADALPRLFDAFYSRRADGRGVGLGLAIVKSIVDAAGGRIDVGSRPEGGAAVRVYLPGAPAPASSDRGEPVTAPSSSRAAPLIAVVESHEYVRRMMADGLMEAGYRVSEWTSTDALVEASARGEFRPDGVIVDPQESDGDGPACIARLRAAGCDVPTLLVVSEEHGGAVGGDAHAWVLRKPFSIADLRRAVRMTLDAEDAR